MQCISPPRPSKQSKEIMIFFFFFFFNRLQNSQRDGFAFCSFLYLSLPSFSFVLSSLFFLSLSGKRRERLGTRVRQALQPLSFHLSGLRALIMKQSLIIKSWLAFQIMQASIMCGNDTPMVTLKNPPIKMV